MSRRLIGPRGLASYTLWCRVCGIDNINTASPIDKLWFISTNLVFITSNIFSNKASWPDVAKGLWKGGAKRHRKVLRDNIQGITKPAICRLARPGAKRIAGLIYEECWRFFWKTWPVTPSPIPNTPRRRPSRLWILWNAKVEHVQFRFRWKNQRSINNLLD